MHKTAKTQCYDLITSIALLDEKFNAHSHTKAMRATSCSTTMFYYADRLRLSENPSSAAGRMTDELTMSEIAQHMANQQEK